MKKVQQFLQLLNPFQDHLSCTLRLVSVTVGNGIEVGKKGRKRRNENS